jgi:hypothetical protein
MHRIDLLQVNRWIATRLEGGAGLLASSPDAHLPDLDMLRELLRYLSQTPDELCRTASNSYSHPNGFDKVVLIHSRQPEFKLRLHVWWPQPGAAGSTSLPRIHNHRWDFCSRIILGQLSTVHYEVETGYEPHSRYLYRPSEDRVSYLLKYIGECAVRPTYRALLSKGDGYSLSHRTLHRVASNKEDLTATLVLQGCSLRESTDVLRSPTERLVDRVDPAPICATGLREKLAIIVDSLR